MTDFSVTGLFILAMVAVLNKQFTIAWQIIFAGIKGLVFGREYNLDGDTGTPDWFEGYNSGDGSWGLTKAVSYHLLYVETEMRDEYGTLHPRSIPILEWIATRSSRRHASKEQKAAIAEKSNDWPDH